jgi:two-component system OmpR family sensor kinase
VVALIAVAAAGSLVGIHQVLSFRLQDRVSETLNQEVLELDRLVEDGRDPTTGRAFESLDDLFAIYFDRNVPGAEEALLAFVGGRLVRSDLTRYPLTRFPDDVAAAWRDSSNAVSAGWVRTDTRGRFATPIGQAHYVISPVRLDDGTASLVVVLLPQSELEEREDILTTGTLIALVAIALMAASTWFLAGRALAPVHELTETAHAISESDLTRRIEVRGDDEAAAMARSFNAMLDRLEAVFRSERQFVKDASHELRDPLTICVGYLGLVEGATPERRRQIASVVTDELDRMARIVDDLQRLAEAEQPGFLELEEVDLALLAHELTVKASMLAPRAWALEGDAEGLIVADRHRVTEAMMNLARNAVEHTRAGDVVALGASAGAREVRLWVRDEGVGVHPDERERIFERFARGDASRRRYRGGGLGLAIVKTVALAHGGRVELSGRYGAGATFTIVLPRDGGEGET